MDNMVNRNNRQQLPGTPGAGAMSANRAAEQGSQQRKTTNKRRVSRPLVIAGVIVALLLALGAAWFMSQRTADDIINEKQYQSVVLSTDLLLFGKLSVVNDEYYKLKNVYYTVQAPTSGTDEQKASAAEQQNITELRRLSTQIHGPQDEMIIPKNQVLYFENLKPDGKASQLMAEDQKQKN